MKIQAAGAGRLRRRGPTAPAAPMAGIALLWGLLLAAWAVTTALSWNPHFDWPTMRAALSQSAPDDFWQSMFRHGFLPRLAMGFIAGAMLAIAGALLQLALRNPLASPTTLGVAAGSQFALALAALLAPWLAPFAPVTAFVGGLASFSLVLVVARRNALDPAYTALIGVAMSLLLASASSLLVLLDEERLSFLFLWGAGHLAQADWQGVWLLATIALPIIPALALMRRPARVLAMADDVTRSLGFPARWMRLAATLTAVFLTAAVVSQVGVIGFVGLAVPAILRLAGLSVVAAHPFATAMTGGLVMLAADGLARALSSGGAALVPAGAVTALIGGPTLLMLVRGLRPQDPTRATDRAMHQPGAQRPRSRAGIACMVAAAICLLPVALLLGTDQARFALPGPEMIPSILQLRWPRLVAAGAAGAALGISGLIVQRLTRNRLASPELLGVSGGAALAIMVATICLGDLGRGAVLLSAFVGAALSLGLVLGIGFRRGGSAIGLILTGVALGVFFDSLLRIALANAGARATSLLSWLSGSTALVDGAEAASLLALVLILGVAVLLAGRCLQLLELGPVAARGLGLSPIVGGLWLAALAAVLAAAATAIVGPLSFVGMLAPQLAAMLGARQSRHLVASSAACGAIIMIAADWVGRWAAYPFEIPAGLVASVAGAALLIALLWRGGQR